MFTVITIAREYGSVGADIGRRLAELLGWECVDNEIIERAAAIGNVDCCWAELRHRPNLSGAGGGGSLFGRLLGRLPDPRCGRSCSASARVLCP
jgi:Cytidylate kinase-like family